MIGAIAGDIIGSVYEHRDVRTTDFPLFSPGSRPTDDSVLTLALADALTHGLDIVVIDVDARTAHHRAFTVAGIRGHPQPEHRVILLVRAQEKAGQLGGLTEAQRQQAGGDGIQAAGVPRLRRIVEPLGFLQGGVGSQPGRFVQQQDAVNPAASIALASAHGDQRLSSPATLRSISRLSATPRSMLLS